MRPLNERELSSNQEQIFRSIPGYNSVAQINHQGQVVEGQTYYYDKVFDENSSTTDVYSYVASDVVKGVLSGINGTVFAYGQTSSGKTHTMIGGGSSHRGILEMAAEEILTVIIESSSISSCVSSPSIIITTILINIILCHNLSHLYFLKLCIILHRIGHLRKRWARLSSTCLLCGDLQREYS